jgi:hypothetical protein
LINLQSIGSTEAAMSINRCVFALFAGVVFAAPVAHAQVYQATFSGAAEVPANASAGTGSVIVTYSQASQLMTITANFSALSAGATAAHIHCCTTSAGTNAGVATQVPAFSGFPLGVTSGTYQNTFDMTLASSYNPAFVAMYAGIAQARDALLAAMGKGSAYFNIHTTNFPGGEIRGNLAETSIFRDGFELPAP